MFCLASSSCCASATCCGLCSSVASGISKKCARFCYCALFGVSLLLSWILREFAAPLLQKLSWINTSGSSSKEWFQVQAVLRVSLGNFLFFLVFAIIMIGIKDQNDKRDSWHHGGWILKVMIWFLLVILMFFIPNIIVFIYGTISKFGAGLFLLVQVVLLLDFTHSWNDTWVEKDEQKWYLSLLAVSIGCYLSAYTLSAFLFMWFNPSGHSCGLNIFFIIMTLILTFVFAIIALHPAVNGSLLPASVISLYCVYVCYASLSSEPLDYACNGLHSKSKSVTMANLIVGLLTTVLSVLYSAHCAGSSAAFVSPPSLPCKPEENKPLVEIEGQQVGYSYTFFHLIFALASMYSAMLLSDWTSSSGNSELVDVGWTSVWVRVCTEWVTAGAYVWTLVAPLFLPNREF